MSLGLLRFARFLVCLFLIVGVHQLVAVLSCLVLNAQLRALVLVFLAVVVLQLRHRLTEIDVNAPVVDEYVVHLEVGALTVLRLLKLDERVL